jgi:hypothetical protein
MTLNGVPKLYQIIKEKFQFLSTLQYWAYKLTYYFRTLFTMSTYMQSTTNLIFAEIALT